MMKHPMKTSVAALFALSVSITGVSAFAADASQPEPVRAQAIAQTTAQPVAISVNGEALATSGYKKAGVSETMVPLRDIAEKLGMTVTWSEADLTAGLSKGEVRTSVKLGEDNYTVDQKSLTLGVAPERTDSKTYVPVSFVSQVLHATVKTDGGSIAITPLQQRENVLTRGVVTEVYDQGGRQFVRINGIGPDGIVLNVDGDTAYEKADGTKLKLSDIALGAAVEVEHSMVATLSLPPQTAAYKITLLEQEQVVDTIGTAGLIEEVVTSDDKAISLRIKGKGITDKSPDEVVLRLNDKTVLTNTDGESVELSALTKGAKVIGYYNGVLTRSLPPIGTAWKIVLQAPADSDSN
ncbi:copper amine oxidase N-terminal domain-containing protein [Paenibacillus hodogayensis]|uniref:Copper amine oxidase N-terminal domain-containing protein n=1 Tax=Paenibacillus hodogayensis TaxID=279208 RepID=A0ABV5W8W7_9BACL